MIVGRFKKGQSIIEYTLLLLVIAAAVMAMYVYISRAINARVKMTQDELSYNG